MNKFDKLKIRLFEILNSVTLRLPQVFRLRSGVKVMTFGKQYNSLFYSIFTSSEYLQLFKTMNKHNVSPKALIDCGAACGYFTLLVLHASKIKLLDWQDCKHFFFIEPNPNNVSKLQKNIHLNFKNKNYEPVISIGLVGKKNGSEKFYFSKDHPWGSSILKRKNSGLGQQIPYIDLTDALKQECVLKIDIEGGEFSFFENYRHDLDNVLAIIIEWHTELGDVLAAESVLRENGFHLADTSLDLGNRKVQLFVK